MITLSNTAMDKLLLPDIGSSRQIRELLLIFNIRIKNFNVAFTG